jgi:hypothetical protein
MHLYYFLNIRKHILNGHEKKLENHTESFKSTFRDSFNYLY